jgi:hypothetical protein
MRLVTLFVGCVLIVGTASLTTGQGTFLHLNPGGLSNLPETVPVNIVFVGYEPSLVNQTSFLSALPATYRPIVRSRTLYDLTEELGLQYQFDYHVTFTSVAWENSFFAALSGLATAVPRTLFQDQYNAQIHNVLDVGANHFIDAPSVEKWLIDHAPAGVDTARNTIFFINWWGRSDFKFHVYTKFGEPDPDTGYDFGVNRQTRKVIAWGGTTPDDEESGLGARGERRVWFHDLSAGPERWTDNWNVDDADVDGDGVADYRLPPIWEYLTAGGYRAATAVTADLARVTRFVAINLLFTSSPLYPPYLSPLRLPGSINVDVNTYEGWRGVDASQTYQTPSLFLQELTELHHGVSYSVDQQDLEFKQAARNCYQLWLNDNSCYPNRPYPGFANLFLYNALTLNQTRDGGGDHEAMMFNYVTEENRSAGFLGYADDNWVDGTQSGVFSFLSPSITALGYGLTTTQIHEYGHHIGMSHTHDGWDSEMEIDYGAEGDFYFTWAGDEPNSIMGYVDLNWDFSQFDRDNFNRFHAAGYIVNANAIAARVLASPKAAAGAAALMAADVEIGLAKASLAAHAYPAVLEHARLAYLHTRTAATLTGVTIVASDNGWTVLAAARGRSKVGREYSHVDRYGPGTRRSDQ